MLFNTAQKQLGNCMKSHLWHFTESKMHCRLTKFNEKYKVMSVAMI